MSVRSAPTRSAVWISEDCQRVHQDATTAADTASSARTSASPDFVVRSTAWSGGRKELERVDLFRIDNAPAVRAGESGSLGTA